MTAANHDDNDSSWDLLASELGLDEAPSKKNKSLTQDTDEFEALPVPDGTIEIFPPPANNFNEEVIDVAEAPAMDDMEEAASADEQASGAEDVAEGPGGGKRRRRRRRRKKGGEPVANAVMAEAVESPIADADADIEVGEPVDESAEEIAGVMVGEAAEILEEDEDDEEERPVGLEDELEDSSAEPLPDMKVVAWTDLIGTLYRPQDR